MPLAAGSLVVVLIGRVPTLVFLGGLSAGAGVEGSRLLPTARPTVLAGAVSLGATLVGFGLGLGAVPLAVAAWWAAAWQPRPGWLRGAVLAVLLGGGPAALGVLLTVDDWLLWLAVLAVAVFGGESAAWLAGSKLGRHFLAPRLSPQKTWEGAIAQASFGLATGLVAMIWLPLGEALLLGLAGGLAAQIGDLAESWCKRRAGASDSGTTFGAQGGFFDLIDGFLGAALVVSLLAPFVLAS